MTIVCVVVAPITEEYKQGPMEGRSLYLDAQATTPLVSFKYAVIWCNPYTYTIRACTDELRDNLQDPRVLDKMMPYQIAYHGNPHSRTHMYGWETEKAVEHARKVSILNYRLHFSIAYNFLQRIILYAANSKLQI